MKNYRLNVRNIVTKKMMLIFAISAVCFFCFTQTIHADELSDLNERLQQVELEKQELQQKIKRLEADNAAKDEKLREKEMAKDATPAEDKPFKSNVSLKYYWDTREYNTFEVATSTTGLPLGFTFWGFTDLHGNQQMTDDYFDFNRFFMEYRLNRVIDPEWFFGIEGLGTQIEYNDFNGSGNQLVRFGLTYKQPFSVPWFDEKKAWVQFRGHPYESDGSGQQVSLIYYIPLCAKAWISGFADLNIVEGGSDQWVIEPQLNIKLTDRTNFLVEYRYNGFEDDNATLDGEGVAIGMDIKF